LLFVAGCGSETSAPVAAPDINAEFNTGTDAVSFGVSPAEIGTDQAVRLEGFPCLLGPAGATTDSRVVITPSGNATLVCKGETAVGPPETLVLDDVLCGVPLAEPPFLVLTTESHFTWTKSGQANLTCHVKAS
jgi:hypothetical protein